MRELYKNNKVGYFFYIAVLSVFVSLGMGLKLGAVKVKGASGMNWIVRWMYQFRGSLANDQTTNVLILCLIGIVLAILVRREYTTRCRTCSAIFSIITSILLVIGRSFYKKNSLDSIFHSAFTMTKAVFVIIGYSILIYYMVCAFLEWLVPAIQNSRTVQKVYMKKMKITFWTCVAAMLIAWLPYVIVYYPCSFCRDGRDEIAQMLGDKEVSRTAKSINYPEGAKTLLNNHHPITYTLLVGGTARLGMAIGNINLAMFVFACIQMIVVAMVYSYSINFIKSMGVPSLFCYLSLGFFMFFPLIPMYAFTITKDSLFGACMILVTIGLFRMIHQEEEMFASKKERWLMFGSCLGLLLFRNNGLYILLIVFIVLLIRYRKYKERLKSLLFMVGVPIVLYWLLLLKILLPLFYIPSGSPREMLSIPFQQVARYAKEWGEEGFEEGEIEVLDKILCFDGDVQVLAKRYNPIVSDAVKNKFNKDYTKEELKEFMVVWMRLVLRHPGTCITATLNNCYYLFSPQYDRLLVYNGIDNEGEWYGLHNMEVFKPIRIGVFQTIKTLAKSSMFGWLFAIGPWDYLFLLCMLYLVYKKNYQYLILTLPVVLNVLICVAGPICYMRYAIVWIVTFPIFGSLLMISPKSKNMARN